MCGVILKKLRNRVYNSGKIGKIFPFRMFNVSKAKGFGMQIKKVPLSEPTSAPLFQDKYGVLKLAANATLARTPKPFKTTDYLCLKFIQLISTILMVIKQLWKNNGITFSDLLWGDPTDCMYSIIWQKRMQEEDA